MLRATRPDWGTALIASSAGGSAVGVGVGSTSDTCSPAVGRSDRRADPRRGSVSELAWLDRDPGRRRAAHRRARVRGDPNEPEGWSVAGRIVPLAYIAWSLWLIALA